MTFKGMVGHTPMRQSRARHLQQCRFDNSISFGIDRKPSNIEIEISHSEGWRIAMEIHHDTTEQIKVRPRHDVDPFRLRGLKFSAVFVPPMTGLATQEPLYQAPR